MGKKIHAELADFARYVNLYLVVEQDGKQYGGKAIELEERADGTYWEPTIQLNKHEAQNLMDSLWQCGLRPTEGSGSAGALAATQEHLKDMRKLVSKTLDVDLQK